MLQTTTHRRKRDIITTARIGIPPRSTSLKVTIDLNTLSDPELTTLSQMAPELSTSIATERFLRHARETHGEVSWQPRTGTCGGLATAPSKQRRRK